MHHITTTRPEKSADSSNLINDHSSSAVTTGHLYLPHYILLLFSICITLFLQLATHPNFNNFIGFLSNGRYSLCWLPLPTKSYTPVPHHICLNASISTFLLAPCDHPPLLTCTSLALIFISVHARFILQLQQSEILSLPPFVPLKPKILSENILKPTFRTAFSSP